MKETPMKNPVIDKIRETNHEIGRLNALAQDRKRAMDFVLTDGASWETIIRYSSPGGGGQHDVTVRIGKDQLVECLKSELSDLRSAAQKSVEDLRQALNNTTPADV
jgi:hypothetical protein